VVGIDDDACIGLLRLFNEPEGRRYLEGAGVDPELVASLDLLGISGVANLLSCVKTARYFELTDRDVLFSVATDSMELYGSRLVEERALAGEYLERHAAAHHERYLLGAGMDHMLELGHWDRRRLHNLKYFTWVEQQGKDVSELDAQWYDDDYWSSRFGAHDELDRLIVEFNERTGLLEKYA
jgi:cysteine synthase A